MLLDGMTWARPIRLRKRKLPLCRRAFLTGVGEIPHSYTRIDHVFAPYGAYLDTGITISRGCVVTLDMMAEATTANLSYWGYRWSGNWTKPYSWYIMTNNAYRVIMGTTAAGSNNAAAWSGGVRQVIVMDSGTGKVTVNGEEITLTTSPADAFNESGSSVYHPYLCGANMVGSTGYTSNFTVYGYEVREGGVLVQKLVPCKDGTDAVGFYDTVRHVFMPSSGSVAFTTGG